MTLFLRHFAGGGLEVTETREKKEEKKRKKEGGRRKRKGVLPYLFYSFCAYTSAILMNKEGGKEKGRGGRGPRFVLSFYFLFKPCIATDMKKRRREKKKREGPISPYNFALLFHSRFPRSRSISV